MALRYRNNKHQRMDTYILIGDGFDELEVIYFLHKFRRAGLPIKSVSLYGPLVFSRQGVGLKADYELADKPFDQITDFLLILPTGGRNGDMLRHDARIRALLQTVDNGNGRCVAILWRFSHRLADDLRPTGLQIRPFVA